MLVLLQMINETRRIWSWDNLRNQRLIVFYITSLSSNVSKMLVRLPGNRSILG